ncbi:MAG: hypothetical protein IPL23_11055 [Saprospiraceae bacterium]|nr:hypothetical protein [Saprospiraceae bacterium]
MNELKERIKKDVKFSHIFVAIPNGADDSIAATAKKPSMKPYERLQAMGPFPKTWCVFSQKIN